jgi:hypothetical protein
MKNKQVLLMGGVGNRLFQIARAKDLADQGYRSRVINIEDFGSLSFLAYRLLGWSNHGTWLDVQALCNDLGVEYSRPTLSDFWKFSVELFRMRVLGQRNRYNLALEADTRSHQIGYFLSKSSVSTPCLKKIAASLKKNLGITGHLADSALVHIRGGDFAAADRINSESVRAFFEAHKEHCFCVTNDRAYVKKTYPFLPFSQSDSAAGDFIEIARSQTILPSNSTFCFWACVIAVKLYGAKLHQLPGDSYWQHLAADQDADETSHER